MLKFKSESNQRFESITKNICGLEADQREEQLGGSFSYQKAEKLENDQKIDELFQQVQDLTNRMNSIQYNFDRQSQELTQKIELEKQQLQ